MYGDMNSATRAADRTPADPPSDATGDFDDYVRASQRRHKRLAFLLTGDLDSAEDLLQAAYAKVYPRWDQVRTYDVPDAYLRRVMVSLRTSWWRRHRNREWSTADLPEHGSGPDAATGVTESQALLVALRRLPDRQRAAVVLRHWCDLSEADTAAIMACSVGTVKSNTSKGLAQLRTSFDRVEGDES